MIRILSGNSLSAEFTIFVQEPAMTAPTTTTSTTATTTTTTSPPAGNPLALGLAVTGAGIG
ncbi:MAG: hypothetical protein KGY80_12170 [Candidatus Thorarchaeota archaeon]|nr:hypothetical protein [Candidatus Thorarchaeota archaeon]